MKISKEKIAYIILSVLIIITVIRAVNVEPLKKFEASKDEMISTKVWEVVEKEEASYEEYICDVPTNLDDEIVLAVKGYNSFMTVMLDGKEIYSFTDRKYEKGHIGDG